MQPFEALSIVSQEYQAILKESLCGIYLHGSLAFGCFNWQKSDIDFIVVVHEKPTQAQKEAMILTLLKLKQGTPPKGFEMSVVLYEDCKNFKYPTPFELHFSKDHMGKTEENLPEYCRAMNGTDYDLAAHFTVIRAVGIVLYGNPIEDVFGEVPKEDYLASIKSDVENADYTFAGSPVYIILNLCRALAYVRSGLILSKAEGGKWAKAQLPNKYAQLIQNVLDCYSSDQDAAFDVAPGRVFCSYMKKEIFGK